MTMQKVSRAIRAVSEAVTEDRSYRGVGRKASVRRKKAAIRAARRANKAILAYEVQEG